MKIRIRKSAAALLALLLLLSSGCKKAEEESTSGPKIGYAFEGVSVIDDENALQNAVDTLAEGREKTLDVSLKTTAVSTDGINFDCYLANPAENQYDMYFQIFGDSAMQDELFLSGLIRPGTAFEHITLNHALNPGSHTAYCVFTLVKTEEDGTQTIDNQTTLEIDLVVKID